MDQVTENTITEAVKQVADAMSNAVKEYGPEAVDLALMAYRVEAAQQLLHGLALAVAAAALIIAYMKFWAWSGTKLTGSYDDEGLYVGRIVCGAVTLVASSVFTASALSRLLDVSAWLAAFGAPELRIAMKALEAAGLM